MPFCSSDSIVVRTGGSFATIGSVTTIASFAEVFEIHADFALDSDADAHGRDRHLERRNHLL